MGSVARVKYRMATVMTIGGLACLVATVTAAERPPTIRIGDSAKPQWAWVDAPPAVVRQTMATLKSPVEQWMVNNVIDYGDTSQHVVVLYNENWESCRFVIQRERWIRLGGEEGLKMMSDMFGKRLGALNAETNMDDVGRLCGSLAYLHKGPKRTYLSSDFWTRNPSQNAWMAGTIKEKRTLKQYFIDPKIRGDGAEKTLTCWIITGKGGVEQWQIRISQREGTGRIVGITVNEVTKEGSFSWGLVP